MKAVLSSAELLRAVLFRTALVIFSVTWRHQQADWASICPRSVHVVPSGEAAVRDQEESIVCAPGSLFQVH